MKNDMYSETGKLNFEFTLSLKKNYMSNCNKCNFLGANGNINIKCKNQASREIYMEYFDSRKQWARIYEIDKQ